MIVKQNYKFLLLCIIINSFSFAQKLDSQYIISSGSKGGNYHRASSFLVNRLTDSIPNATFSNVNSNGSLENLSNLEMHFSDFALVQRNILLNTIYNESNGIKNLQVILPLFQEKLLIYHNQSKDYFSIKDFIRLIDNKSITTLGFTGKDSYSYEIFDKIVKLLNIPTESLSFQFNSYDNLIVDINNDKLDAIVSFSLEIEKLEKNEKIKNIYFTKDEVNLITSRITNTNFVNINGHYSIGTYTFLIGINNKIDQINDKIDSLHQKDLSKLIIDLVKIDTSFIAKQINKTIKDFKSPTSHAVLEGIPLTEGLQKELMINSNNNPFLILLVFLPIIILLILISKKIIKLNTIYLYWIKHNHIFFGIILLLGLYYLCLEIMIWAEKDLYNTLKLKSQILNMSRSDLHLWAIVSNLTGENNGIFPISTIGKLMYSVSFYTIFLGGICIFIVNYLKTQTVKKRNKGMKPITLKNHIVLCGWNNSTESFIENFLANIESQIKEKQKIVCVVENVETIRNQYEAIKSFHDLHKIELIEGDIKQDKTLKQSNIIHAKTVVIFSEDSTDASDEKTLLRALSISRFCRKFHLNDSSTKSKRRDIGIYSDSTYIIAELNNEKYKDDLLAADVNEVVCSNNYSRNIISQSIINHGLSNILDKILTFNKGNEFYTIDLSKNLNKIFVGKTFDELLIMLRRVHIQLIAINVVYHDKYNNKIIDNEKKLSLTQSDGLESSIIINPSSKNELNRKVDDDDVLVVFAEDEHDLSKKIKQLNNLLKKAPK
jgi:TRAP-type uncharacterized transport system substrate-binding protein/cadmium resistance protein CadD (predicted permease)